MNADTFRALQQFAASTYVVMEQFANTGVDCTQLLTAARNLNDCCSTELSALGGANPPWTPGSGKPPWGGGPVDEAAPLRPNKFAAQ